MAFLSRCPRCGKLHLVEPERCGCGHSFAKGAGAQEFSCPRCGEQVDLDRPECPGCRGKINDMFSQRCPSCGARCGISDRYCKCGTQLIVETGLCPYCGKRIRADSASCPECGRAFGSGGGYQKEVWVCARCGSELQYYGARCLVCGGFE
jgi:predicted amidophosphoribosyltransferase